MIVDVLTATIPGSIDGTSLYPRLSSDERARADRIRHEASRLAYVVAHAMLRHALSARTGVPAGAWDFATEPTGRPFVVHPAEHRQLRFSLAHCTGLAVCCVASAIEVGIDAEGGDRPVPFELADRHFAPEERSAINQASAAERRRLFLRYWTLKEAYLKARGLGLSDAGLAQVRFADVTSPHPRLLFAPEWADASEDWYVEAWTHGSFEVALTARANGSAIIVRRNEWNVV